MGAAETSGSRRATTGSLSALLGVLALPVWLTAQVGHDGRLALATETPPYDGRFTFTRVRYAGTGFRGRGGSTWAHDYPEADRNMHRILDFLSRVRVHELGTNVFTLDDPEIFRNPILYLSEPGYWSATESELRNLGEHLLKGGLLILDDFEEEQWINMEAQLRRALPEHRFVPIDDDHSVFQTLVHVADIHVPHPFVRTPPRYMGIFEENDPTRRIMVLANHNSDLAEYWEWSATGYFPMDITNEAYALGVNYLVYGLTY
jgi:hypothetical protein